MGTNKKIRPTKATQAKAAPAAKDAEREAARKARPHNDTREALEARVHAGLRDVGLGRFLCTETIEELVGEALDLGNYSKGSDMDIPSGDAVEGGWNEDETAQTSGFDLNLEDAVVDFLWEAIFEALSSWMIDVNHDQLNLAHVVRQLEALGDELGLGLTESEVSQ